MSKKLVFPNNEWSIESLEKVYSIFEKINKKKYQLDIYDNQIEIITYSQMIDLYSTTGLPKMYDHWSFGKQAYNIDKSYKQGQMGLAFEIVINTNPAIAYCMETNSAVMQATVICHASYGHNFVFKNNYMFKQGANASSILSYLRYAQNFISECEEKYGKLKVEYFLDDLHSLQYYGVDKYKKNRLPKDFSEERNYWQEELEKLAADTSISENDKSRLRMEYLDNIRNLKRKLVPEENILYFLEKNSPVLEPWQKECIRIVRKVAEYFYPQMQTKVLHEGFATFTDYHFMSDLWEQKYITESQYMEYLSMHARITYQPTFDKEYYSGLNPYALGFAIFMDVKRMCENPDEEDLKLFPEICNTDYMETIKYIVSNYKDSTFIKNFLGPKVIKQFGLFNLKDDPDIDSYYKVTDISKDYENIVNILSRHYEIDYIVPNLEISDICNLTKGLVLQYTDKENHRLKLKSANYILEIIEELWGSPCILDISIDK